jgi:glycerol-3-phosphate cytidylyltransferase
MVLLKKIIGITFSTFDLLHEGHVRMLEEAKEYCDYLIVALQTDPSRDQPEKNKPVQSVVERYVQLKGCKFVDEIIPYTTEKDIRDILQSYPVDIRIVADEYKDSYFTGRDYHEKIDVRVFFNTQSQFFSTDASGKEAGVCNHLKRV